MTEKIRKRKRLFLRIALVLIGGSAALYAARWPLLGGVIRSAVAKQSAALSLGGVSYDSIEGSILGSLRLKQVRIETNKDSTIDSAQVEQVEFQYPWFGLRGVEVSVRGAIIRTKPGVPSREPLQQRIRQMLTSIENQPVRRLRVRNSQVDGFSLERLTLALREDHAFTLEADAAGPPGASLRVRLHQDRQLEATVRVAGREAKFQGETRFDENGLLERVKGRFEVEEGDATVDVNLLSGELAAQCRARLLLERQVRGDVSLEGGLQGNLSQPPDKWTVSAVHLRGAGSWKDLPFEAELKSAGGKLGDLPWEGQGRRGGDALLAFGTLGWSGAWNLACRLSVRAANLDTYQALLPAGLPASARDVSFDGMLGLGKGGPWIEGTLDSGPGKLGDGSWTSLRLSARVSPKAYDVCELKVVGAPGFREAALTAQVLPGPPLTFQLRSKLLVPDFACGAISDLDLRGSVDSRGVVLSDCTGKLGDGPFRAMGRWDFQSPKGTVSLHLVGGDMLVLSDRFARLRLSPDLWLTGDRSALRLTGDAKIASLIYYDDFHGSGASGKNSVQAAAAPRMRLLPDAEGGFVLGAGVATPVPVELDLTLETQKPVRIENSTLGALMRGTLQIRGTLAAPALSGQIDSRSGEVKLATGVVLKIEQLRIELPPGRGATPGIYFKGHSGKGQGMITAVVVGPLAGPSLSLSSVPPRKQEELIAYLAFGRLPGEVGTQDALGVVATKVIAAASDGRPRAKPREGVWQKLDLTVASEDAPDAAKRAPWDLPPTASARGTILRTEYVLSPLLSVVMESDREANVSGDIKIRLHFR